MAANSHTADLFVPAPSTTMPAVGMGYLAFLGFADGDWPFRGRKTPKNPHPAGSQERIDWQRGYDAALSEWFQ